MYDRKIMKKKKKKTICNIFNGRKKKCRIIKCLSLFLVFLAKISQNREQNEEETNLSYRHVSRK